MKLVLFPLETKNNRVSEKLCDFSKTTWQVVEPTFKWSEVSQSCGTRGEPMDVAFQAPPSMEFFRQGYWNGLPFPSPGDLPGLGIEPKSPTLQADALSSELPE